MPRRIAVVTGTRAEYGLLRPLCGAIAADPATKLQLIVTGMHLSPEFGMTVHEIEADGLPVAARVEMQLSDDTPLGITKSMSVELAGFADAFGSLCPDFVVLLGDRFEIFMAAAAAVIARLPIAHIHGGEATEGAIDEQIRHAITKMAHIHFPVTEMYRHRIIQMGENPARVFNFGAPALDTIRNFMPIGREELSARLNLKLTQPLFVATFHPVTLQANVSLTQCQAMLTSLDAFGDARIIITYPNADMEGRAIISAIEAYAASRPERVRAVKSLGQMLYLSLISIADLVIGNSSSGLLEAPHFAVPTVDIGDRQRGRYVPASVIHCEADESSISKAIRAALEPEFRASIRGMSNPYGNGTFALRALEILKSIRLDAELLMKHFFAVAVAG